MFIVLSSNLDLSECCSQVRVPKAMQLRFDLNYYGFSDKINGLP